MRGRRNGVVCGGGKAHRQREQPLSYDGPTDGAFGAAVRALGAAWESFAHTITDGSYTEVVAVLTGCENIGAVIGEVSK